MSDQTERCRHCGLGPDPDGDHSCPCPNSDEDCPDHPAQADHITSERLADNLRRAIRAAGLTQAEVAERAELDPTALSKILTGKRKVSSLELALICTATGSDVLGVLEADPIHGPSYRAGIALGEEGLERWMNRAEAAEARVRELEAALQQSRDDHQGAVEKLRAVEALADDWAEFGEGSEAWRVFGAQHVSVPFAVDKIRAALTSPVESDGRSAPDCPKCPIEAFWRGDPCRHPDADAEGAQ